MFFSEGVDIVLQPYGAFLSKLRTNQFLVIDRAATSVLLDIALANDSELETKTVNRAELCEVLRTKGFLQESKTQSAFPRILTNPDKRLRYVRADIEVTNRCNLACLYCYAEVNKSTFELSLEEWKEILTPMHENGLRAVLFSGGEPFIRDDFVDLLKWSAGKFITEINTNGRYIDSDIAAELSKLNLKRAQVSLDSFTSEHHDNLRGKHAHRFAINAIEALRQHDVPVQISCVATKKNECETSKLIDFAAEIGATINISPVTKNGFAANIDDEMWSRDYETKFRFYSDSEDFDFGGMPICQSAVGYVDDSFAGDLKPCNQREGYFEPSKEVALLGRENKWWLRDFGETKLGEAVAKLPFDSSKNQMVSGNNNICHLQNFLLGTLEVK